MWQVALLVELVSEMSEGNFFITFELEGKASLLFPIRKAFQNSRTWLREGSRCVNVLLLPKSVSNLSSICRASFWWGAFQLAIGHESRFKELLEPLRVSLSRLWHFRLSTCHLQLDFDAISYLPDPCAYGMPVPEAKEYAAPCIYYRH